MNYKEFAAIVEKAKRAHPILTPPDDLDLTVPPATPEQIANMESEMQILLPEKYKQLAQNYGTGLVLFEEVFAPIRKDEWDWGWGLNENQPLEKPYTFVAVMENGCGDYYGFQVENSVCGERIYFWDHETSEVRATKFNDIFELLLSGQMQELIKAIN